jgi:flagellar basal-body rod modification protein FlgD
MTTTAAVTNNGLQAYLNQQASSVALDQSNLSSGTSSTGLATAVSASTIGSNFNTFINILTTQLKNQDPTSATDPNQFTQELVQFAQVEQQLNTNNDLQSLINLQKASGGTTAALNYIGGYAEVPANGQLALQNSSAEVGYNLTSAAQSAQITVTDSSGNTVATLNGSTNSGLNYVKWNGVNSDGTQLADGTYKFSLVVTNTDGSIQNVTDTRTIGLVSGVTSNSDGTTNLQMGTGFSTATSGVDAVYETGSLPAQTTTTS